MLEAYCAFGDYATMMETVESLITTVAQKVLGTLVIKHDQTISFSAAIQRVIAKVDEMFGNLATLAFQKDAKIYDRDKMQKFRSELLDIQKRIGAEHIEKLAKEAESSVDNFWSVAGENVSFVEFTSDENDQQVAKTAKGLLSFFRTAKNSMRAFQNPKVIDLTPNWKRAKYKDLIRERIDSGWFERSSKDRLNYAEQFLGVEVQGKPSRKLEETSQEWLPFANKIRTYIRQGLKLDTLAEADQQQLGKMLDELSRRTDYLEKGVQDFEVTQAVFEKLIEPTLIQPTFVTHLPKELVPLAKLSPDDPTTVEVFECCINGQEISPGYTEQNDPIAQRATLEHQAGGEQQKLDEDFLVALEHGMPPAGGIGIGIDRLCMMLLGQESIRDVILFPQLKPK
jgi:lysyl-tRNA synthetase class II